MKTYNVTVDNKGTVRWSLDGKLHRENGPAIEYANGAKSWFINGKRHRENGPAVEFAGGDLYWFINGKNLTEEEFNNRTNKALVPVVKVIEIDGVRYELNRID